VTWSPLSARIGADLIGIAAGIGDIRERA